MRYSADLPIDLFGENHVQELVEKTDAGAYNGKPGHFIGHLQTNKVNKVVGRAALIQSVDSTRLLDKIDAAAERLGHHAGHPDGDQHRRRGKQKRRRRRQTCGRCWKLPPRGRHTSTCAGLMAIPPADADDTATRRFFAADAGTAGQGRCPARTTGRRWIFCPWV